MKIKVSILFVVALFLLQACNIAQKTIYVENDKVMKTRRVKLKEHFYNNKKNEAQYSQYVDFIKETDENNVVSYLMYDIISVPIGGFDLEEKMYIIIDEDIYRLNTLYEKSENNRQLDENRTEVLLSDSSKTTVVTDVGLTTRKIIKMKHSLEQAQIDQMLQAKEIHLRYYLGPDIINSEIKGNKLQRVKKWILK